MVFIRNHIKILFLLVIPVHFFIAQNSLLNKHTHFYANGIVVTHSHPVDAKGENPNPIQNHKHTKTEICLFHCLNFDYYTVSEEIVFQVIQANQAEVLFVNNDSADYSTFLKSAPSRAPPFLG